LQALEQKMEQLQVNSERYTQATHDTYTLTREPPGRHGKRIGKSTTKSLDVDELGEVSLTPARGQVFVGAPGKRKPLLIAVGATLYTYLGIAVPGDHGRPWVRSHNTSATSAGLLFPYHGQPDEVSLGGSGAYAGLINLLATAVAPIGVTEHVVLDGQTTTEFTATVEPLRLVKHIPAKVLSVLRRQLTPDQLEVLITEAGLPVRVVLSQQLSASPHTGVSTMSRTTDILAVNIPVSVKPPPARRTIGEKAFAKLLHTKRSSGLSIVGTNGTPATHSIAPPSAIRRAGGRRLAEFKLGRAVATASGCLACHRIGDDGNPGPGPSLTHIGAKLSAPEIEHALRDPKAPMPSFKHLPARRFKALVEFLSELR
jgi:hypothetical protein